MAVFCFSLNVAENVLAVMWWNFRSTDVTSLALYAIKVGGGISTH